MAKWVPKGSALMSPTRWIRGGRVSGALFFAAAKQEDCVMRKGGRYPFLYSSEAGGLRHSVEERVPGTCEEICFERRRVAMIVAPAVRFLAW